MNTTHGGNAPTDPTVFDEIVALFDDKPVCEMTTGQGPRCTRTASWRINLHGCEQALMCGQHLRTWTGTLTVNSRLGTPRCGHCGHQFATVADAYTVTPL